MDEEDQKFMALAGLRTWCAAVLRQVERIEAAREAIRADYRSPDRMNAFQSERHLFLISAWKMFEHIDWALKLRFLDSALFETVQKFREDVNLMRNKNEHVIEYFLGKGKFPENWLYSTEEGTADASSTVGTRIGGRLDWREVERAARELLEQLPLAYLPSRDGQPGHFFAGIP